MTGRPEQYPIAVREYVVEQVCDHGRKLQPLIGALNRGELEPFGKVPVSYSTARGWVDREKRLRDAIVPLEDAALDSLDQRLLAVGLAEMRKLERDSHKTKPVDPKRLNELQAFSQKMRRHIARDSAQDTTQPQGAQDSEQPESMLDRLAREELSTAAPSTPQPTQAKRDTSKAEQQVAQIQTIAENVEAIPVHVDAQPLVASAH